MKRLPSIRTLRSVFQHRAPEARRILEMTRAELEAHPVGAARVAECYHAPTTRDLRMAALNSLDSGLYGVEGFVIGRRNGDADTVWYLNAGDTYTPTLVFWAGAYRVESWGDRVEILERQGWRT
jgi:hypothetical protein